MNRDQIPENPSQLYDLLQELFGIGTHDDLVGDEPWFRSRMTEAWKLKAMLRKRRCTVGDVTTAAWYAHDNGIPIPGAWKLFGLIPEAQRAARQADRASRATSQHDRRNAAANEAIAAGEQSWADRLISASDRDIDAVIDQWRNR